MTGLETRVIMYLHVNRRTKAFCESILTWRKP